MSTKTASIVVNGKRQQIALPCSVGDLLAVLGWKPTQVVVERNGEVVVRSTVGAVMLGEGDQVEIILPVAGG
jgi:thiamine biosynthesis protein ThiS